MTERANLFTALAKAQQAAQGVEKASSNAYHKYKYASSEDVITEARRALDSHGLAFFATDYRIDRRDDGLVLAARYLLTHSSGESLEMHSETPIIPEKGRPEDKATAAAKTYDLAYLLRGLLLLPRVEEGVEVDSRNDEAYQPRQRPTAREIQEEARQAEPPKDGWPEARERWIRTLGDQLFADCVGCDVSEIRKYTPPEDPTKRAAVRKTLEGARRDLEAMSTPEMRQ